MDVELWRVAAEIRSHDDAESRFGKVIRGTFDQIYDGVHTGRYRWDQLRKTEKTHFGSIVEINLQREFGFADGEKLDYRISDVDVDCKYSQTKYQWMIPIEAQGEICLVVTADDQTSTWSAGLVRAESHLLGKENRDRKRSLNAEGRASVEWIWEDASLAPNVLLSLPEDTIRAIFYKSDGTPERYGQRRLNQAFRLVQGRRFTRGTIETLAQQKDSMKRARAAGGSRTQLRPEGIVIFGDYSTHGNIAARLGLPIPQESEFVSARLAPATPETGVEIDGGWWRLATEEDGRCEAPSLPGV
jgi:hypothetical protein